MNGLVTRSYSRPIIIAGMLTLAGQLTTAQGQTTAGFVKMPPVPPAIEAPAGHRAFLKGYAVGTQNYICLPSGWTFLGPQATLFVAVPWITGDIQQQIATHFLSRNPGEGGTARPTWQSSLDTSAIWGKAVASSNDPQYVAAGAIPWLLVEVVGTQKGPAGGSIFSQTSYIQRVNTSGGAIPTGACTIGVTEYVSYTSDYVFYRPSK